MILFGWFDAVVWICSFRVCCFGYLMIERLSGGLLGLLLVCCAGLGFVGSFCAFCLVMLLLVLVVYNCIALLGAVVFGCDYGL